MFNSQKILRIVFVVLFLILLAEVFYFFVYRPTNTKKAPTQVVLPTKPPEAPNNVNQVGDFIARAKAENQVFVSYYGALRKLMAGSTDKCALGTCFELANPSETDWISEVDRENAVSVSDPFVVRLHLSADGENPAEISLSGRVANINQYEEWWRNPNIIFVSIGFGNKGKQMYIGARNKGSSPYSFYDHDFDKPVKDIYLLFDQGGKRIVIADPEYNVIADLDINKITSNKFPEGLFPDRKLYIGYGIAPKSNLVIYDLSILSLK